MDDLQAAVARNDWKQLEHLLAGGFDPNTVDSAGRSALMNAAIDDKVALMQVLLRYRADANLQDQSGLTALHFAAQEFHPDAAELLCSSGALVNLQDRFGNGPLWKAVFGSQGRGEVIRILLQHGADSHQKNKAGKTPLDLANTIGNYDVKQFFSIDAPAF